MSALFGRVRHLVSAGERQYSAHAVRELAADGILIKPLVDDIEAALSWRNIRTITKALACSYCNAMRLVGRCTCCGAYRKGGPDQRFW